MSTITASTGYESQLWLDNDDAAASYAFNWGNHSVTFLSHGFRVSTEVTLTNEEQVALVECLAREDPSFPSSWGQLTPELHRTVERVVEQILDAASHADHCLRQLPKGARLAPLELRRHRTSAGQIFPVVHWQFSEEERQRLRPIYEKLGEKPNNAYPRGISIPMPVHFEARQVLLTEEEVTKIGELLNVEQESAPFRRLYAIALQNFVERSYESAILILATSVETALKSWLIENGDPISEYLLTNIQSPPIDKLYSCARKHAELKLPKHFARWVQNLRDARNDVAHTPLGGEVTPLEVARWFAVGEAILGALTGHESDPLVGFIVEPIGQVATERFPSDSRGVVLRRETLYGENSLHVVFDTGDTIRFGDNACKKSSEQVFSQTTAMRLFHAH